ncbi:hypothetical protein RRF57_006606 [Xylaria bambusicola]|uniref:Uncharacterized protein n=1 Tax=Xylaria bambusicola TaxID=326684 RepID=A0AAN7Z9Y4_9PEZI
MPFPAAPYDAVPRDGMSKEGCEGALADPSSAPGWPSHSIKAPVQSDASIVCLRAHTKCNR